MRKQNKINVLHAGPLPPPFSGLGISLKNFLGSETIRSCSNFVYNTSSGLLPGKSDKVKLPSLKRVIRHLIIAFNIAKEIKKNKINILHFQGSSHDFSFIGNWISIFIAKILGVKVLWHIHDDFNDKKVMFPGHSIFSKFLFNLLIRSCDVLATLTYRSKEIVRCINKKLEVEVIPPCVDVSLNNKSKKQNNFIVLYVGWLVKDKGIFDLIKIALKLKELKINIYFNVLGTGMSDEETKDVYRKVEELKLNDIIHLKGVIIGKDKEKYFENADVFISPTYWDAFPLVILEAMAFGLPIITTRVGGIPEIIGKEGNEFLHQPGDIDGMVNSLLLLKDNQNIRAELGEKNRNRFKNYFDREKIASKTIDIYYRLVEKH